jgi:hypothetical protein
MCGFANYQDPRLQPSDVGDDEMTPAECYMTCAHAEACVRIYRRETGELYDVSLELGCGECDQWEDMG